MKKDQEINHTASQSASHTAMLNNKPQLSIYLKVAFGFFVLAGLVGLLLRAMMVWPMGLNYQYILHTHSHVMFLGWLFNALYAGFLLAQPVATDKNKRYRILFWLLQFTVLGMLFSFPFQGYALFSITFSTLHIFLSYYFCWKYYQDAGLRQKFHHSIGAGFIGWALLFHLIGTVGPFALGPIMAKGLGGSEWYYLAIYHYLHFEYNGLFTFGVLGLFFSWMESRQINYPRAEARWFLWCTALACAPAFALSALWTEPPLWVWIVAALSAVVQLAGLLAFLKILWMIRKELEAKLMPWAFRLFGLALICFVLKLILQAASALPDVARLAAINRNVTIAYLHLVFLGFVTPALIGWCVQHGLMRSGRAFRWAALLFLFAFVLSELALVLPQISLWLGQSLVLPLQVLVWISALLPVAAGLFFYSLFFPAGFKSIT